MVPEVTPDGWLRIPYDGPDLAVIEMEAPGTDGWQPAYLDYGPHGARVAQIRWNGPPPSVLNLRVDGELVASWP